MPTRKAGPPAPATPVRWGSFTYPPGTLDEFGTPVVHLPALFSPGDTPILFPGHRADADRDRIAKSLHAGVATAITEQMVAAVGPTADDKIRILKGIVRHAEALLIAFAVNDATPKHARDQVRALAMLSRDAFAEAETALPHQIGLFGRRAEREIDLLRVLPDALATLVHRARWGAKRRQEQIRRGRPDGVLAPAIVSTWVYVYGLAYGNQLGETKSPHKVSRAALRCFITLAADRLAHAAVASLYVDAVSELSNADDRHLTRLMQEASTEQTSKP